MRRLFASATLRLTGWYLIILACISLLFSAMVYQIVVGEVDRRLTRYQNKSWSLVQTLPSTDMFNTMRSSELAESRTAVVGVLAYVNLAVLVTGGGLSYLLARRTLRPIEEAHESQARFVSDASHELRTPLASMITELEVALDDPSPTKQELRQTMSSSLEEAQRLSKLSSILLELSSTETVSMPSKPFNITATIEQVGQRLNKTEHRINLQLPNNDLKVIGNPSGIEELLSILLDNALKHSPSASLVDIKAQRQAHRVIISVTNSGEGISSEHLPHIFKRFYRTDSARTHSSGYGLGLALAQQIASLHKTTLTAESTPGKTTTFSFSLPSAKKFKN